MTVRLSVDRRRWETHVDTTLAAYPSPVPVVKGNGYGFGREGLAKFAAERVDTIAVGTVHELDAVPSATTAVVLTPTLVAPERHDVVLTVAAHEHVDALASWSGRVLVKLASSMQRYGGEPELIAAAGAAGLDVLGVSVHPPLAASDTDHVAEIVRIVEAVDPALDVWASHVGPSLTDALPGRRIRHRIGTTLWHGDREALHLAAQVIDVRATTRGSAAGYRSTEVPVDGHLVMVGAGTAHGVAALPDGRSPFHHRQQRLQMFEPPHMHTTMLLIPNGEPLPVTGDWLDLQRPLTQTMVDEIVWV
jgi:alanine racemase